MMCSETTRPHAFLGAVLALALALALAFSPLAAAPAHAADADSAASQQRLAQMEAARAGGSAEPRVSAQQAAPTSSCATDPQGDTTDNDTGLPAASPNADILEHCAGYGDSLNLQVRVATPTNPSTTPNWEQGTFVGWFVDTDDDGAGEFFVDYSLDVDGELAGRVLDLGADPPPTACEVAAVFDGTSYASGPIPAACIGSPAEVAVSVGVFFNQGGEAGTVFRDSAPDGDGFANSVAPDDAVCTDPLPAPFADRDDIAPVHQPNVDCLFSRGITLGVVDEDGVSRFVPRPSVTRGQFSAFTFRTLGDAGVGLPDPRRPRFDDVPAGRAFDEEIHRLAAAEVLLGYAGGNLFGPQDGIRRDQSASVIIRSLEHATNMAHPPAQPGTHFADTVGNFHSDNIDAAFEEGIVQGVRAPTATQLGLYGPGAQTTRQQMASVLVRFLKTLEGGA